MGKKELLDRKVALPHIPSHETLSLESFYGSLGIRIVHFDETVMQGVSTFSLTNDGSFHISILGKLVNEVLLSAEI